MADRQQQTSMSGGPSGSLKMMSRTTYVKEALLKNLFLVCAVVAVIAVALIFVFTTARGWEVVKDPGLGAFLGGTEWASTQEKYGILPLVNGTLAITFGALLSASGLELRRRADHAGAEPTGGTVLADSYAGVRAART